MSLVSERRPYNADKKTAEIAKLFQPTEVSASENEARQAAAEIRQVLEGSTGNYQITETQLRTAIRVACEDTVFQGAPLVKLANFQFTEKKAGLSQYVEGVLLEISVGSSTAETVGRYTIIMVYTDGQPVIIYKPSPNEVVFRESALR